MDDCDRLGETSRKRLITITQAGACKVHFIVDWGDGSAQEEATVEGDEDLHHTYAALGRYTITVTGTLLGGSSYCSLFDWNDTKTIEIIPRITIDKVALHDIDRQPLRFLSTDDHSYFSGHTRVHGTITVRGAPGDKITAIWLEVSNAANDRLAFLADAARNKLLDKSFGADGRIEITVSRRLFLLSAADASSFNSTSNDSVDLRVVLLPSDVSHGEVAKQVDTVPILVRYKKANRYPPRDESSGGDDWVKPTVRTVAVHYPGIDWGDFSNMNGGAFPPHGSHRTGNDIDGHFREYNSRDGYTAKKMIRLLNKPIYGARIRRVLVTYNRPGGLNFPGRPAPAADPFWQAIKSVTLNDGRKARAVIKPEAGHAAHFHWKITN